VAGLLDPKQKAELDRTNREDQARLRTLHSSKKAKPLMSLESALQKKTPIAWRREDAPPPPFVGRRALEAVPLAEIAKYIDWTFFFTAWELTGKFPQILEHPQQGEAARDLYAAAQRLLKRIVDEKLLTANAVYGYWPAAGEGNDIVLFTDESRSTELLRFNMLRQQQLKTDDKPYAALSDFVAPTSSGVPDHI